MKRGISMALVLAIAVLAWSGIARAADGKALFDSKCAACHGADGKKVAGVVFEAAKVRAGKAPKMPAYDATKLPDADLTAIVDYAKTLK